MEPVDLHGNRWGGGPIASPPAGCPAALSPVRGARARVRCSSVRSRCPSSSGRPPRRAAACRLLAAVISGWSATCANPRWWRPRCPASPRSSATGSILSSISSTVSSAGVATFTAPRLTDDPGLTSSTGKRVAGSAGKSMLSRGNGVLIGEGGHGRGVIPRRPWSAAAPSRSGRGPDPEVGRHVKPAKTARSASISAASAAGASTPAAAAAARRPRSAAGRTAGCLSATYIRGRSAASGWRSPSRKMAASATPAARTASRSAAVASAPRPRQVAG